MKIQKHILLICVIAAAVIALLWCGASAETASGSCGDNLSWALDDNGVLTISGMGEMSDFVAEAPWYNYKDQIMEVQIDSRVTYIGEYAFYDLSGLTNIMIPDGVERIGYRAFWYCTNLASVTIPDSVTIIGSQAFCNCSSITDLTIPDSITSIGDNAFLSCTSLTSINIGEGNEYYSSTNGILYNKDQTALVVYPAGRNGEYIIPDSITSIGNDTFWQCTNLTSITIPDSITSIGDRAFGHCYSLTNIRIPDSVTSIGVSAFLFCDGLTSITIPDGVTSIGDYTFYYNLNLTAIRIPDSVTSIGEYAFNGCTALNNIYYSGAEAQWNLVGIGSYNDCLNNAFIHFNSTGSETIIIDSGTCGDNLTWVLDDNGVLTISGIGEMADLGWQAPWLTYSDQISSVQIDNGVTSIGDSVFSDCSRLTSVLIPASVVNIGESFIRCTSLMNIQVDDENMYYTSEEGVLFNKEKTELIVCPMGKTGEYYIPDTVNTIGKYAFSYCNNLTSITVPESVMNICESAFTPCNNLAGINVSSENAYYSSADGVLFDKEKTTIIVCPIQKTGEYTIPDSVVTIEDGAFAYCSGLTGITLPNDTVYIGGSSFQDCSSLMNITIPSHVTTIKGFAFYNCSNLASVDIPDSVTSIESYAFDCCNNLTDVYYCGTQGQWNDIEMGSNNECLTGAEIHYGLSSYILESGHPYSDNEDQTWTYTHPTEADYLKVSFSNETVTENYCDLIYLTDATGNTSEYSGTMLAGKDVYLQGQSFTIRLTSDGSINYYGFAITNVTGITESEYQEYLNEPIATGTCGDNLTWVLDKNGVLTVSGTGEMADLEWSAPWSEYKDLIYTIVIEQGVTSIGNTAFCGCYNLEDVTIPDTLTSVGNYAFSSCGSLKGIAIPGNVTYIGTDAFSPCNQLASINVSNENAAYSSADGVLFNKDKTILITYPAGTGSSYTIPDSVTSIGYGAFWNCESLTSVTIPDSVTTIGDYAFNWCMRLTSIIIPNSVTDIGCYAFGDCGLTSINIPDSVISIGGSAFCNCSLTSVTIPESVTYIGDSAFSCYSLENIHVDSGNNYYASVDGVLFNKEETTIVTYPGGRTGEYIIPDTVTELGASVFNNCTGLTSVIIPDGITYIGYNAFNGCTGLMNVSIPTSVTGIGVDAFCNCYNLTCVTIPEGVTEIGMNAFWSCGGLKTLTIPASVTSIGEGAFGWCNELAEIYYTGTEAQWNAIQIAGGNDYLLNAGVHYNINSGACGNALVWRLDDTGILTISGAGEMADYSSEAANAPWYGFRENVLSVRIENGVTGIGEYAFLDCLNLTSVSIPGSVVSIRTGAFQGCTGLTDVFYDKQAALWNAIGIGSGNECLTGAAIHCVVLESEHPYKDFTDETWTYSHPTETDYLKISFSDETETDEGYGFIYLTDESGNTVVYGGKELAGMDVCLPGRSFTIRLMVFRAIWNCYGFRITSVAGLSESEYEAYCSAPFASGTCGENIAWELNNGGFLRVSGTGDMVYEEVPWTNYRKMITAIQMDQGISSIGDGAFSNCANLLSVSIPDSVTRIGERAFMSCSRLPSVTIPDSVISIGYAAFECQSLTEISVPASVTSIGRSAFNSRNLMTISVDDENAFYSSEDGVLFNKEKTKIITYPSGRAGEYSIPASVTSIGEYAFSGCQNLTNVIIPDHVSSIEKYAFCNCTSLMNIMIPDRTISIGEGVFSGCSGLISVSIPDSVTSIETRAFNNCTSLTSIKIPGNITSIGDYTFSWCTSLRNITIPDSVTNIGEYAFSGCESLTDVYYAGNEAQWNIIAIGDGNDYLTGAEIHFNSTGSEEIIIASGTCGDQLTWKLEDNGVLTISGSGEMTNFMPIAPWYSYRDQITTVQIDSGVTSIGSTAFNVCSNLTSVTIPDSVTDIGDRTFSGCSSLTGVTIPENVTSIGNYAFSDCGSLTSITIPVSVTNVGDSVFLNCGSLTGIHVNDGNANYSSENGVLFDKNKTVLIAYPGGMAGEYTVPDSVTRISGSAFNFSPALTGVNIPASVTSIERSAFTRCSRLTSIHVDNGNAHYSSEDGVLLNKEKTTILVFPRGRTGEYVIPDTITNIGEGAFATCKGLTSITIPDSVTGIGFDAFESCSGLISVTIPDSVTSIPGYTFSMCSSLKSITIPDSVTEIGELAFYLCESLESITIPNAMSVIGEHAFEACRSLTDVYYDGTEEQWNGITMNVGNECLTGATIHFHTVHTLTAHNRVEPTCTATGNEAYWSCEICGKLFSDDAGEHEIAEPVVIPTAEGPHRWGEAEYIWAEDKRTVTARRVCEYNAEHVDTKETAVTCEIISPTETDEGSAVYTAEFGEEPFEAQTMTLVIPALNTLQVMRLPSGIMTIEQEAFSSLACQAVIIPEGCTTIGENAFAGCSQLVYVRIPASVENGWPENAFEGCSRDLIIDYAGAD